MVSCSFGQNGINHSDEFLSRSFKVFHEADFEMAYYLKTFLRERFIKELQDSTSFYNPYDSLSGKYVSIQFSPDSLVKTYSWDERNGSCCYASATFAQFKTGSGKIDYVDLEIPENDGVEIFLFDLQNITINETTCYLILGWGTCCGGKQYEIARVYQIKDDNFILMDSQFDGQQELIIGANRGSEIDLKYDPDSKILSYNYFEYDEETGFYNQEKSIVEWHVERDGFERRQ